jgi:hypothetical protein
MATGLKKTAGGLPALRSANALAPASVNSLAPAASNPLQRLLQQAATNQQYQDMSDYLSRQQMMPPIGYGDTTRDDFLGVYRRGPGLPKSGVINFASDATPRTAVHELTHAADYAIQDQYRDLKNKKGGLNSLERQFIDGYEKLVGRKFSKRRETVERIAPDFSYFNRDYRSSGPELAAFGIGSTEWPNQENPAPLHVDSTYATEFAVLLDLARRLQKPAAKK